MSLILGRAALCTCTRSPPMRPVETCETSSHRCTTGGRLICRAGQSKAVAPFGDLETRSLSSQNHAKRRYTFHDVRMRRRAIEWLSDAGLIDERDAESTLAVLTDQPLG